MASETEVPDVFASHLGVVDILDANIIGVLFLGPKVKSSKFYILRICGSKDLMMRLKTAQLSTGTE